MSYPFKKILVNLSVSILGFLVGISYLMRYFDEACSIRDLITGILCMACAVTSLVVFLMKNRGTMKRTGYTGWK